jgi:hypothetical protein
MKTCIKQQYCLNEAILHNNDFLKVKYDLVDLKLILDQTQIVHISNNTAAIKSIFFNFYQVEKIKHKIKYNLFYYAGSISDFNSTELEVNKKIESFWYTPFEIQPNQENDHFFLQNNISKLNFINLFKMSHLTHWHIYIINSKEVKPNCSVLNSFLALGAKITFLDFYNPTSHCDFTLIETHELSFQHGINLYKHK